ncbi:MAG: glycosyltransferase family 1 protein [Ignavibacteriae bacterium]|nr:MAG: glycosyltransferase family 1 protein [Ignavibacteriota bacterium]
MNVLYDHQVFSSFAYGGVSRIFFELMSAYSMDPGMKFELSLKYSDNEYLNEAGWNLHVEPFLKRIGPGQGFRYPLDRMKNVVINRMNKQRRNENRDYSRKIISEGRFDVFHPTYFDPYFLDSLHGRPYVLTVFDLIYELYPGYFPSSKKYLEGKSLLIHRAAKIIAISEHTKNDLKKFYNVHDDKIEVVYLASSLKPDERIQRGKIEKGNLPERYLLYVGNRAMYKNFIFFIESIQPLLTTDGAPAVVCAGGNDFTREEKRLLKEWGVEEKLFYTPINDSLLASLYRNAVAFVFPSLYEGFGIPILEAFACGCPVLISNTGSLPEIAGEACLSFDPRDKASILDATRQMFSSKTVRAELCAKGTKRLKLFSWKRTADETKRIYESVAS